MHFSCRIDPDILPMLSPRYANGAHLIPGDVVDENLAAKLVGTIEPATFRNRRHDGRKPAYTRRGKTPLYSLQVLAGWIFDGCP